MAKTKKPTITNPKTKNAPQPKEMDKFTILKLIGHGGFGKVFLASDNNDKLVAIKIVPKPAMKTTATEETIEHLKNEISVLQSISSSGSFLCRMLQCFENGSKVYMVMEFYQGGNLHNVLEDYFKMDLHRLPNEEEIKFYVAEIVCGLEYLHSHDMVYRDLKPENIMIEKDGHIKLADFGLCKPNFKMGMTTDTICGTEGIQAPEMRLRQGYGHGVDIWALGVSVYETVTNAYLKVNEVDFSANLPEKIFPESSLEEVSVDCSDFIRSLLTANPENRPEISQVKELDFLNNIVWEDVDEKRLVPPYIPKLKNEKEVSRFGKVAGRAVDQPLPGVDYKDLFTGFEFNVDEEEQENPVEEPEAKKMKNEE